MYIYIYYMYIDLDYKDLPVLPEIRGSRRSLEVTKANDSRSITEASVHVPVCGYFEVEKYLEKTKLQVMGIYGE